MALLSVRSSCLSARSSRPTAASRGHREQRYTDGQPTVNQQSLRLKNRSPHQTGVLHMIAVTGATGQLGRLVIASLLKRVPASEIIAAVRTPSKAADLAALGGSVQRQRPPPRHQAHPVRRQAGGSGSGERRVSRHDLALCHFLDPHSRLRPPACSAHRPCEWLHRRVTLPANN